MRYAQRAPESRGSLFYSIVATPSRFELPISALTGRRVGPLHHGATLQRFRYRYIEQFTVIPTSQVVNSDINGYLSEISLHA